MFKLKRYLKPYLKESVLGPLFKSIEAVLELIIPLVMAAIIDTGIGENAGTPYIFRMGGVMVLLYAISLSSTMVCQYMGSKASQGVGTKLRADLFSHISSFSHKEFDTFGTATLLTRTTNDINQIQLAVALAIRLGARLPILIIGATVMAMRINMGLSVVFLVAGPLVLTVIFLVMKRSLPYYRTLRKKLDALSLIARENLDGVRVIRAFSRQDREKERFDETLDQHKELSLKVGRISALLNPSTFLIMNLAIVAIVWFGGARVHSGVLSQGQVIAFISYMMQISLAIVMLAMLLDVFAKGSTSAARVNEVFDTAPSIIDGENAVKLEEKPAYDIAFENVSFSYYDDTHEYALTNIDFRVEAGEQIGIIGGTGSGKTTLASLIPRFYDATKGRVLLSGVDTRNIELPFLRDKVGIVQQDNVLFSGTVQENLRMGKENITDEELRSACKTAQASEFIENLPDGYDAKVVQGGRNFSGGQRQRLAIARTLVGNPSVLILDDSASALDFATDAALRSALRKKAEASVFVISQRVNSVRYLDKIIVLDNGSMVGFDTHDNLLKTCEIYCEIYNSQVQNKGENA